MAVVAYWLVHCTYDSQVVGSTPGGALSCKNSGKIVHTHGPLSASSRIQYWPNGSDALWLVW